MLLGEGSLLDKVKNTAFERLDIIPSEVDLCGADVELARSDNYLLRVAQALQPVLESQRFDLVLVDCPPSLGILTLNAFAAADGLLVPLQCEYYALEGISMMNRVLTQLRDSGVNPRLEIFGVVMTMFDGRTKLSHEVVSEVRGLLGDRVFETVIPAQHETGGSAELRQTHHPLRQIQRQRRGVRSAGAGSVGPPEPAVAIAR